MTVFPDGSKERLHGHNYFVALSIGISTTAFEKLVPFQLIKDELGRLCQEWKEHTLVAENNPFHEVVRCDEVSYEFRLCGEHYLLPRGDVLVLPVDNITVENLAAHFAGLLRDRLEPLLGEIFVSLEVTLTEVPGQGASCEVAVHRG